jgi:hypothetical protein
MRAVKTYVEMGSDKSLILKSLPFALGRVEVIVFPTPDGEDVFPTMDRIVKRTSRLSRQRIFLMGKMKAVNSIGS